MKIKFLYLFLFAVVIRTFAQDGPSSYYKNNPTLGKKVTGFVVDGNPNEWKEDMLIVQGVANDDARTFRGPHEAPVYDLYQLYAAWDEENLYLMWQIVNVTDVVSPEQGYPNSDNGKPWNGDIPFQLIFDIDSSTGSNGMIDGKTIEGHKDSHIWGIYNLFDNNIADKILMFSSKPKVGNPGIFSLNANGKFDYTAVKLFKDFGITYAWGDYSTPSKIFGINKDQHRGLKVVDLEDESQYVDFNTKNHKKTFDTIYEMKIPFVALGIDASYLENTGIGVMLVSTFGQSAINSLPYDVATTDNAEKEYSSDASTSKEKEDVDKFSSNFARIGKESGVTIIRPKLVLNPLGGTYIGGTEVTATVSGDNPPFKVYYTLDGTKPTKSSTAINSGDKILIPSKNTTLKAFAVDSKDIESFISTQSYITEEPPKPDGIKIGFKNTNNWDEVYIYAWQDTKADILGAWPGIKMNDLANNWKEFTFLQSVDKVHIVINNNNKGLKTLDLKNIIVSTCFDATSKEIVCENLSTEQSNSINSKVELFPNPVTNGWIYILSNQNVFKTLIHSVNGSLINSVEHTKEIDVRNLSKGVYYVTLILEDGSKIYKKINIK